MRSIAIVIVMSTLLAVSSALAAPVRSSGDARVDRALRSWTVSLNRYFGTDTVLRFDSGNHVNAYSHPGGEVTLYYGLLEHALASEASWTYLVFVLAHEWGHQLQRIDLGSRYRLSIQNELQADCLGAYYLFTHLQTDQSQLNDLIFAQVPVTSDRLGTPWWLPTAHGTGDQRVRAITQGWRLATHQYWMGRLYRPWELYHGCYH